MSKLCKDCRHFRHDPPYHQRCHHPVVEMFAKLMDGSIPADERSLHFVIMRLTQCGANGDLWEPKP